MSNWDDGTHSKVKKVQLTYEDVIYSIQVTYEGTLQSSLRGSIGPKSAEFTLASDEYITALNAYGKALATQEVITSLTFITNKKTYGPYGNKSGYQISAHEITGKQVAGFLGTSGNVINSIDVHYAPVPTSGSGGSGTEGSGTGGSGTGGSGTGGSGTGGSGTGGSGTGGSGTGGSGTGGSGTGGSGTGGSGTGGSGTGGSGTGGSGTGGSGTGGSGTGGSGTGGSGTGGSGTGGSGSGGSGSGVQKLDAQGGTGGTAWDDGSDHDGVTKITAKSGDYGIQFVKFDYVKGGQPKLGATHGVPAGRGLPNEIVINHPQEYLVSVEGWYDSTNVIIGIQFKTNQKTSDYIGYDFTGEGTKFTLQVQDKKIIGFHGFASNNLNSIGAYFVPSSSTSPTVPPKKLKAEGGETGAVWDDGAHDNVKKVYVGQGDNGIGAVKFVYANGSEVVYGNEHGKRTPLGYEEFELESDEYIESVEGTYDSIYGVDSAILTRLIFKTNKKTAGPFGLEGSKVFTLKEEGHKIVGFHGRAGPESINAIGAYVAPVGIIPLTPSTPIQLGGVGGDGGTSWDDGAYDGVRKVYVGQADDGIGAVKFVYDKGAQPVTGNEHGKRTMLGYEEFVLDYPSEYITAVEGTYDNISASNSAIITMLKFTTNKRTSGPFGLTAGTPFTLKKEGHKIVGFHGNASDLLHKVGVHVLPITN